MMLLVCKQEDLHIIKREILNFAMLVFFIKETINKMILVLEMRLVNFFLHN